MNNSVNHSSIHNNSSLNILPYIHKPKKVKNIFQEISIDMLCFSCHTENVRFYCRNLNAIEVPIHYIGGSSSLKFKSVTEALKILFQLKKHEKEVWLDAKR